MLALGFLVWAITLWVATDVRWFRARDVATERIHGVHTTLRVPVWGLFVNRIRLGDKASGDTTPDDMVFVFDMRVPPEVLRRQRARGDGVDRRGSGGLAARQCHLPRRQLRRARCDQWRGDLR